MVGVCLDEETVAAYLRRGLSDGELAVAEAHLAACEECRGLVDLVAAVSTDVDAEAAEVGEAIGRFVVLRRLGAGAFGVVYAAFDPELDRRLALKIVRSDRARILREAQAMARLSHPNVTAVFDVTENDGEVCIAMEYIDGADGRAWLDAEERGADEILEVFTQAGRGLAAAHAAGVVHRDFKPSNILVGHDGRVSVSDFGLARGSGEAEPDRPSQAPEGMLETSLTQAGAVVGTPRYMAPEQLRGEVATARSDQFGFCVALFEALAGGHPFGNPRTLLLDDAATDPAAVKKIPRWLRAALLRGLRLDPAGRFGTMEPLLDRLSLRRRSRARRIALTSVGAIVLATVPAAWVYDVRRTDAEACTGGPDRVAEVFGEQRQAELAAAFEQSGLPYAATSWGTTHAGLSRYLERWEAHYTDACETAQRGEQSQEVLTARMLCLDQARDEVRYVTDALASGSLSAIRSAVPTVQALADLSACADADALLRHAPAGAAAQRVVAGVRAMLARARAAAFAGDLEEASAIAEDAVDRARELDHAPLVAEALLQQARGRVVAGDADAARVGLREAILLANRGRHDRLAAEAWIDLLFVQQSMEVEQGARAALERLGRNRPLWARHATAVGLVQARAGRYAEALAEHQRSAELLQAEHGERSAAVGVQLHRVAEVQFELGRLDDADASARQSAEIVARTYGGEHPRLALPLTIRARVACAREDFAGCVAFAQRAAALRMAGGKIEAAMLPIMLVHAEGLAGTARTEDALTALQTARDLARRTYGDESAWAGRVAARLAHSLASTGSDEAEALANEALAILDRTLGEEHPDTRAARKLLAR